MRLVFVGTRYNKGEWKVANMGLGENTKANFYQSYNLARDNIESQS